MYIYKVLDTRKQRVGKGRYIRKGRYSGYFAVKFKGYEIEYWSKRDAATEYTITIDREGLNTQVRRALGAI